MHTVIQSNIVAYKYNNANYISRQNTFFVFENTKKKKEKKLDGGKDEGDIFLLLDY